MSKLFRTIGRINSMLFLLGGLLAIGILGFALYQILKDHMRGIQTTNVVNTEPGDNSKVQLELGTFEQLPGTRYLWAPVVSTQNYRVSSYDKETTAIRNYLFVNAADKSSRWLLPNNHHLFLKADPLRYKRDNSSQEMADWVQYEVITADTNQDGQLTREDQKTIALSRVTGENYKELIPNVSQVLGSTLQDKDTLLFFYTEQEEGKVEEQGYVAEIRLVDQNVTTKALPPIQP